MTDTPKELEWGDADLPAWISDWADDVCDKAPYPDHGYAPTQRVMGYVRWLEARVFVDYTDTDEELAMARAYIVDLEAHNEALESQSGAWQAEAMERREMVDPLNEALGEGTTMFNFKERIADLTAELERYKAALKRICTGQALDPHMSHDPVALSECPVAYCIARQALQEQSGE